MGLIKRLLIELAKMAVFASVIIGSQAILDGPVVSIIWVVSFFVYVFDDVAYTILKRVWRRGRYGSKGRSS